MELAEKTDVNSITPSEVGNLIGDVLNLIDEYNKNVVGLGIRKTYRTIAEMQEDATPVGADGKPLRFGQLVSVYDIENPDNEENGGVYAFQNPGWILATTTAVNVVNETGDSDINAVSQKLFTEVMKDNRHQFLPEDEYEKLKESGKLDSDLIYMTYEGEVT